MAFQSLSDFWLLDQHCPVRGWQHGGILAFTDGQIDGLGPKHFSTGSFAFSYDRFEATARIQSLDALDPSDSRRMSPDSSSMFRHQTTDFIMQAQGHRAATDLIVGDLWAEDKPATRYLFRLTLMTPSSLSSARQTVRAGARRVRSRVEALQDCKKLKRQACTGAIAGIPIESLRALRGAYDWQAEAA